MEVFLSRFAFIFIIYAVISSGYINQILSCQMQRTLNDSIYFRHMLGILLLFVFIMLEGGWSFDAAMDDLAETNWSSGNVLHTLVISFLIYVLFVLSSKSRFVPNLVFFTLVLLLYIINTQRSYWKKRDKITEEQNKQLLMVSKGLFVTAMIVLVYGFIDYVQYQKKQFGKGFDWSLFLLGTTKCSSMV